MAVALPAASGGRLSGLTTRGRCLLAAGGATAVCALVLDERDLLRMGALVAVLPLLALLLAARGRRAVRVEREVVPDRVPVGVQATVTLHLRGGPLLGAVRLVDAVPDAAGPSPAAPPEFTVHRRVGRTGAALAYPLRPALRGVHRIGPLAARTTDPLGLAEFERELAPAARLFALPRVVPLRGLPPAPARGVGTLGAAAAHQGPGRADVLVRPYRHGDELRRVHWRSTARHDELMVRMEEQPWRGGLTVLLDRRGCAHRGRGARSSLEFAVELAASVCAHLVARGEPVALVGEDGTDLAGTSARQDGDALLETLAALRPSARTDLACPVPGERDVLAVLGAVRPDELAALVARRPRGGLAVLLDTATWDPAAGQVGAARSALVGSGAHAAGATGTPAISATGTDPFGASDTHATGATGAPTAGATGAPTAGATGAHPTGGSSAHAARATGTPTAATGTHAARATTAGSGTDAVTSAALLRRAGWRVAVATAASTADRVWDELCAAPGGPRADRW